MKNSRPLIQIRSRKLGVLIYDSRINSRRNVEECAAAMGVTPEVFSTFEHGSSSPSLPQVELLSIYLNVPLEHFWDRQSLSATASPPPLPAESERILALRNRVISASLRLARKEKNINHDNLSTQTGISMEQLQRYERAEIAIPLPELEALAVALEIPLANFYDQHGPLGKWRAQQEKIQVFLDLPPDLQSFVCKPVNRPYLDIALKLSDLPVDKLRILAESLLEITY